MEELLCIPEYTEMTTSLYSHTNERFPSPVAKQKNVSFPNTLAVILLGLILTIGGDTASNRTNNMKHKIKILVRNKGHI